MRVSETGLGSPCLHNKHSTDWASSLTHFFFSFLSSISESSSRCPIEQQVVTGLLQRPLVEVARVLSFTPEATFQHYLRGCNCRWGESLEDVWRIMEDTFILGTTMFSHVVGQVGRATARGFEAVRKVTLFLISIQSPSFREAGSCRWKHSFLSLASLTVLRFSGTFPSTPHLLEERPWEAQVSCHLKCPEKVKFPDRGLQWETVSIKPDLMFPSLFLCGIKRVSIQI